MMEFTITRLVVDLVILVIAFYCLVRLTKLVGKISFSIHGDRKRKYQLNKIWKEFKAECKSIKKERREKKDANRV